MSCRSVFVSYAAKQEKFTENMVESGAIAW